MNTATSTTSVLRAALEPGAPLSALTAYPRFIVFRLEPDPERPGKYAKRPCDHRSGQVAGALDPNNWTDHHTALDTADRLGEGYGVGFVIGEGWVFVDIDSAYADGKWSDLALQLVQAFNGCAVEISLSHKGLHILGRATAIPEHSCKNKIHNCEYYSSDRFVALSGLNATGDASTDCTAVLPWLTQNYFPASVAIASVDWNDKTPRDLTDDELVRRMLVSKSSGAMFGSRASPADLWAANTEVLARIFPAEGRPYDASSADAALAAHLAWWCRKSAPWMWAIMWNAGCKLRRDKWHPETHKTYLTRTIENAIARQDSVREPATATVTTPVAEVKAAAARRLRPDNFVFYLPSNAYVDLATQLEIKKEAMLREFDATTLVEIDVARRVHCRAWDPTEPLFIFDRVMAVGTAGWVLHENAVTMNTFQVSNAVRGDAALAGPWLEQVQRLYPDHWRHLVDYFAYKVQHPGDKINHGIVLGGPTRIGKDSILAGPKYAVGDHNWKDIAPAAIFGDFTPWTKCVMLRINEAHDTGDVTRAQFYERMKTITTAPPEQLTFNDKHVKSYPVRNCCGVIVTTNHETGAMYLPPDDCRWFVLWSRCVESDYSPAQWASWWKWFEGDGKTHVAALLHTWDLSGFNPKAPPARTPAWHTMVSASISDGDDELADLLDALGRPAALTLDTMRRHFNPLAPRTGLAADLDDVKKRPTWPGRMAKAGYTVCHAATNAGRWIIGGKRQVVYALRELPERDRQNAADALARAS